MHTRLTYHRAASGSHALMNQTAGRAHRRVLVAKHGRRRTRWDGGVDETRYTIGVMASTRGGVEGLVSCARSRVGGKLGWQRARTAEPSAWVKDPAPDQKAEEFAPY